MRSRDPIVAPTPTARSPSRFGQARVGRVRRPGARARAPRRRSGAPARHIPPSAHTPKPQSELTPCSHAFHVAAISRERRRCALRLAGPPLGGSGRGSRAGDAIGWGGRREADREHLQWLAAGGSPHCTPGPNVVSVWSASLSLQRTHLSELLYLRIYRRSCKSWGSAAPTFRSLCSTRAGRPMPDRLMAPMTNLTMLSEGCRNLFCESDE